MKERKVYRLPNGIQYIYEFEGTMDTAPTRTIKSEDGEVILWNLFDVFNLIKVMIKDLEENEHKIKGWNGVKIGGRRKK